jgi:hypothetical protein
MRLDPRHKYNRAANQDDCGSEPLFNCPIADRRIPSNPRVCGDDFAGWCGYSQLFWQTGIRARVLRPRAQSREEKVRRNIRDEATVTRSLPWPLSTIFRILEF